jgi:hypothetical protein
MDGTRVYVFKPLIKLTFWVQFLAVVQAGAFGLWGLGIIISMLLGGHEPPVLDALLAIAAIVMVVSLLPSVIVAMLWVYGACRNAHVLAPDAKLTTPAWAVGWFFVPVANLYMPYRVVRDIWIASYGKADGQYLRGSPLVIFWWCTAVLGSLAVVIARDDRAGETFSYTPSFNNWFAVFGILAIVLGSTAFNLLVAEIHRNQLANNTTVADAF